MILEGDCRPVLQTMPSGSVHAVVTSPPYWGLRDYGVADHLGLEPTPEAYVENLVGVFREIRRVLRVDGTAWLNLGDSYANGAERQTGRGDQGGVSTSSRLGPARDGLPNNAVIPRYTVAVRHGLKPKDLVGIPWRVAFALQADGWWLRSDIVWAKPNPMPESVTDRPTAAHEHVFLLAASARYFYDADADREPTVSLDPTHPSYRPNSEIIAEAGVRRLFHGKTGESARFYDPAGRNARNVWTIATRPFSGAHFATFPIDLPTRCIKLGTSEAGACRECGAPWIREVDRPHVGNNVNGREAPHLSGSLARPPENARYHGRTIGWRPSCDHAQICTGCDTPWRAEHHVYGQTKCCPDCRHTVPCTVLDPFAGAGTVGVVSAKLGRQFVGIELSSDYAAMARRRIENWRREYATMPAPKVIDGQLGLLEAAP